VITLTSRPQHIFQMPQLSVQPINKEAYTAAPLPPPERGAKSSDLCLNSNKFYAVFSSVMAKAGHAP
jgi:hypothetical protein